MPMRRCPSARGRLTWVVVREVLADMRSWLTPRRLLSLTLVAGAVGFGVVEGVEAWWYKVELARADRELAAGRYGPALGRLERLSTRWTGRAEVEYPRGVCEAALGHVDAALAAWERVPRDSSLGAARSWTAPAGAGSWPARHRRGKRRVGGGRPERPRSGGGEPGRSDRPLHRSPACNPAAESSGAGRPRTTRPGCCGCIGSLTRNRL